MMRASEVCEALGVHRNTLLRWTRAGKIRGVLFGNTYRYRMSEVTRVMDEGVQ